uniref:RING-type domain-containing protein n=1 Tax=Craspedostauros australis TaxID=1486917 RepID=A0A7R9ZSJ7_9STRA|mmetsp:Transcript_8281/g.22442  ORF Transcript_8281/g.22442 Transcript_8281/m.22442 type:complete len:277 (+) Transcript_8281:526-1356(+)
MFLDWFDAATSKRRSRADQTDAQRHQRRRRRRRRRRREDFLSRIESNGRGRHLRDRNAREQRTMDRREHRRIQQELRTEREELIDQELRQVILGLFRCQHMRMTLSESNPLCVGPAGSNHKDEFHEATKDGATLNFEDLAPHLQNSSDVSDDDMQTTHPLSSAVSNKPLSYPPSDGHPSNSNAETRTGTLHTPQTKTPSIVSHECVICMESFEIGDDLIFSKNGQCSHAFHEDCIVDYMIVSQGRRVREGSQQNTHDDSLAQLQSIPCPCCRCRFV